jgi:uridylate kinase
VSAAGEQDRSPREGVEGLKYRRVLLKISGEMLAGDQKFGISPPVVERLVEEIKYVHDMGVALGLVIGGGNIVRGTQASREGMDRVSADYMGMLATIINALALQDVLERKGVHTRVLTAIRMEQLAEPYIRRRAMRHLEKGRVIILAGGTGNPYFSTDTAAVLRGIEMEADVIIKATKVDGVYTADPVKDADAVFIPEITYLDALSRELGVMDAAGLSLCKENDIPILVLNLDKRRAVADAIIGERIGTLVHSKRRRWTASRTLHSPEPRVERQCPAWRRPASGWTAPLKRCAASSPASAPARPRRRCWTRSAWRRTGARCR